MTWSVHRNGSAVPTGETSTVYYADSDPVFVVMARLPTGNDAELRIPVAEIQADYDSSCKTSVGRNGESLPLGAAMRDIFQECRLDPLRPVGRLPPRHPLRKRVV